MTASFRRGRAALVVTVALAPVLAWAEGVEPIEVRTDIRAALDRHVAAPTAEGRLPRFGVDPLRRVPQISVPSMVEDRVTRERIREVASRAAARDLSGEGAGRHRGPGAGRRDDRRDDKRDDRRDRREEKREGAPPPDA
jgi:hypothetical protein